MDVAGSPHVCGSSCWAGAQRTCGDPTIPASGHQGAASQREAATFPTPQGLSPSCHWLTLADPVNVNRTAYFSQLTEKGNCLCCVLGGTPGEVWDAPRAHTAEQTSSSSGVRTASPAGHRRRGTRTVVSIPIPYGSTVQGLFPRADNVPDSEQCNAAGQGINPSRRREAQLPA